MRTAAEEYGYRLPGIPPGQGAEWGPRLFWQANVPFPEGPALPGLPGTEVEVYVNQGRWIVECPVCKGAQVACHTDPKFLCNVCANVAIDGRWRRTVWPPNRNAIEAALEVRPNELEQNWFPGETVDNLLAENVEHGVVAP